MTNPINPVRAKGGLTENYQEIQYKILYGDFPKAGTKMMLKDNLTNEIKQNGKWTMFNINEKKEFNTHILKQFRLRLRFAKLTNPECVDLTAEYLRKKIDEIINEELNNKKE